jgi:hypothetical protein
VPICPTCAGARAPKHQPTTSAKTSLRDVIATLSAARVEYRNALGAHAAVIQLYNDLSPGNPDGTQALRNANNDLMIATTRFEAALRDFMAVSDQGLRNNGQG